MEIDHDRAEECSDELGRDCRRQLAVVVVENGEADRHRRVDISSTTAKRYGRENPGHHRECPTCGDHYPAAVLGLRLVEQNTPYYAIAQHNEDEGAHQLAQ